MSIRVSIVQECDATDDAQGTAADKQKSQPEINRTGFFNK
jgi:hypothetical protein